MNWKRRFCIATAVAGLVFRAWGAEAGGGSEESSVIDIEAVEPGEVTWNYETGVIVATNTFVVRYQGAVLTARRGELRQETGELTAEGGVVLQRDTQTWRGDRIQYNLLTREIRTDRFRTGLAPVYAGGDGLSANPTNGTYTATNAYVTTDDVETPGYRVRARSIVLAPGQYVEARNAVVYLGKVPVFYFPYYRRKLDKLGNYFTVTPGYRSLYGPFALGAYHWFWDEKLYGALNFDYRVKRGFGGGPDVNYDYGRWGKGEFRYYYLYDQDPSLSQTGTNGYALDKSRDRLSFLHSADLLTNLTAKVAVREQSDPYVIRDFFESEYRENPQPTSFGELDYRWSNFSLNALTVFQVNDFFETVERLPDVKLTGLRQQLGVSPFYYDSDSSFGYYRREFANSLTNDYAAMRGDTYHQMLLPMVFFDWLNVTPRVGGRFTYYGESEGGNPNFAEEERWIFNTGAEVSFKASRVWDGAKNRLLDVNGLRHIFQPSLNYVYVPSPNVLPPQLPQFDYQNPSLRLLPLDFPDYNSIDSIDSMNAVRIGVRNKVQTKREEGVENVVNWAVYTDWRINPRPDQQTFSDLYSDLDFMPRSWLTLGSMVRYGINDDVLRESDHVLTVSPTPVWSVSLGHRYLREDVAQDITPGNNLIYDTIYFRLNENWGWRMSHRFEAEDGTLEEQYYTLYRDFRSWTGALTFRVRDNRDGPTDYGVSFTFSLKALPRYALGDDRNQPSRLLGY